MVTVPSPKKRDTDTLRRKVTKAETPPLEPLVEKKGIGVMDILKGFRTAIFGGSVIALGLLENAQIINLIEAYAPQFAMFVGTGIIVLRFVTTSSMFKPE